MIKGIVQGVGFRPFVYNLANEMSVRGYVTNTSGGVFIEAEGERVNMFVERLKTDAPPLSRITSVDISVGRPAGYAEFSIRESTDTGSFTLISPDISICHDCLKEMSDLHDRRYLYPFINCTNCGPRYSITRSVPYDRSNTTMEVFRMCEECAAEYADPRDRRFHAQPNACHKCGPKISLFVDGKVSGSDPVKDAVRLLKEGKVVAIKGLGGFHLACDGSSEEAVGILRERKRRNNKPFALMAPDLDTVREYCLVSEEEATLLSSAKRPIVLLKKRAGTSLPQSISPNNSSFAFMLPYTPLHYLLFGAGGDAESGCKYSFKVLVMTSGNLSEEPILIRNEEAVVKLQGLADALLLHDRDIFMRVDDSVVKLHGKDKTGNPGVSFVRRARGYTPEPVLLDEPGPVVLGCGADLKNTFAFTQDSYAIVSQHIGDMEHPGTQNFFEETLTNLLSVYRAEPEAVVHDLHPGYYSKRWAMNSRFRVPLIGIQHHYAHVGSVLAENCLRKKVIGVVFDGNGYGDDGTLWGGEFLVADAFGYKRAGHIGYTPLPGGEIAIREPWRISISCLKQAFGERFWEEVAHTDFIDRYGREKVDAVVRLSADRQFSPLSSGAGRLFDAISALTGICDRNTFEGEAAIALESLVAEGLDDKYSVGISQGETLVLDYSPVVAGVIRDMGKKEDLGLIAAKFHNSVGSSIIRAVRMLSSSCGINDVVLSGGVFQNSYLTGIVVEGLRPNGLDVYVNQLVPCNDAGIALGQAYIIRERIKAGL